MPGLGWRGYTEPFPRGQAPQSHGMVCFHSSLPPPFPTGVQGRELAPASGTWFRAPSAGAKDGTKGGLTVGAEALGPFSWSEGRAGGEGPPPVAPTSS